jgi:hypothetical protein
MRTKSMSNAKLIVTVRSNKGEDKLETISVFDNRENISLTDEKIAERNIKNFLNLEDLKETLNWNLNGDSSKYQFQWGQSGKDNSEGRAYIFD